MFCIFALPRTASTYAVNLINNSLNLHNPVYRKLQESYGEIFNPKFGRTTEESIKYLNMVLRRSPLQVIKLLTNQSPDMIEVLLNLPQYKKIFLRPTDVKQQVLSYLISSTTKNFFGSRPERKQLKGTLVFTEEQIKREIDAYYTHCKIEKYCDYSFYKEEIIETPEMFIETLGLSVVSKKLAYTHVPPSVSDYDMLQDPEDFNRIWSKLYE